MSREIDKLKDNIEYRLLEDMVGFGVVIQKGAILTGELIKKLIRLDINIDRGIDYFFKDVTKYPFDEGDDYWTIESKKDPERFYVIQSCWDDQSEEMHNDDSVYFNSLESALHALKGRKPKHVSISHFMGMPIEIILK